MTNITLSAQDEKIQMLREVARDEKKTANDLFREWLDTTIAEKRLQKKKQWLQAFDKTTKKLKLDLTDGIPNREERSAR